MIPYRLFCVLSSIVLLSSCTEPGETTGVAAATGGVLGAGLGAIVGNQTGDAGTGLAIGTVAGASTGALVGNALEAQEKSIRSQDEAIERQEQTIAAQRSQIEELRRMNRDTPIGAGAVNRKPDYRGRLRQELEPQSTGPSKLAPASSVAIPQAKVAAAPSYSDKLYGGSGGMALRSTTSVAVPLQEREIAAPAAAGLPPANTKPETIPQRAASGPAVTAAGAVGAGSTAAIKPSTSIVSEECRLAANESEKGRAAGEPADKLFHYRRAIRYCPSDPNYHVALGEVYLTLNRREDAQFEFKEALSLDPSHLAARQSLESLALANKSNRF